MTDNTIEVTALHKRFGAVKAVDAASFQALPGRVTGFLGPNGSGKTTTLGMILGLIKEDSGSATIGGKKYADLKHPAFKVGAVIGAPMHPSQTGRQHLEIQRTAIGADHGRVSEVLGQVGMSESAHRKTAGYSLGMKQRLALATALLGDPEVLILDEPINGLDPEGIRWIRDFLRYQASLGRTVLLSSHLLTEVQQSVDDVVVIRKGKIVYRGDLDQLQKRGNTNTVLVDSRDRSRLRDALTAHGLIVRGSHGSKALRVDGSSPEKVGELLFAEGIALTHLSGLENALESSFLELVGEREGETD